MQRTRKQQTYGSRKLNDDTGTKKHPVSAGPVGKLSSREFNQDVGKAKRAAEDAPVVITDRGKPAFVLMTHEDYQRLLGKRPGLSELLNDEATRDLEFEPARIQDEWLRPADFD